MTTAREGPIGRAGDVVVRVIAVLTVLAAAVGFFLLLLQLRITGG